MLAEGEAPGTSSEEESPQGRRGPGLCLVPRLQHSLGIDSWGSDTRGEPWAGGCSLLWVPIPLGSSRVPWLLASSSGLLGRACQTFQLFSAGMMSRVIRQPQFQEENPTGLVLVKQREENDVEGKAQVGKHCCAINLVNRLSNHVMSCKGQSGFPSLPGGMKCCKSTVAFRRGKRTGRGLQNQHGTQMNT